MMKKLLWVLLVVAIAVTTHILTIRSVPILIMEKATKVLAERGGSENEFLTSPRITPETQSVVRPSPDLAYSVCRFDISQGPVVVAGATWPHYASLTIFDHQTNAVYIARLTHDAADKKAVVLHLRGTPKPVVDSPVVTLSQPRGVALIRRLAPSEMLHQQATKVAENDHCGAYQP